ncbi:hypothetical protein G3I31_34855 [Streptomyces sp. SID9913]|uniref:hypothetical protein n=1 Tax=Streptomyces sp. SID9913 TaxID=2706117 RepID=UPI0013DAD673|nr:hypothetical protein [Streptomyces sp. SID9913]NED23141.1 hypothetical protein [Streptomyces sp. SID9913]
MFVACAALLVSVIALIPAWSSAVSGESQAKTGEKEAERRGSLEVTAVSARFNDRLKGVERAADSEKEVDGLIGPQVDIAVRNRGSGSAIITKMIASVSVSENLTSCAGTGGDLDIAARYDIPIPTSRKPPFTVTTTDDVFFDVKSGENDRLSVTVGPEMGEAGMSPWVGVVTLQFHDADGTDLSIGPLALVSPGQDEHFHPVGMTWKIAPRYASCMDDNARRVQDIMEIPHITPSKEFAALHRALRPFR